MFKSDLPYWNWSSQWNLHGDSLAGVLFRFAYANVLSPKDIKRLISNSAVVPSIGLPLYEGGQGRSDWQKFFQIIGFTKSEHRKTMLGDWLEALRWSPIYSDRLRYCPDCLSNGYHARYFQISALANCPIHRRPLLEHCAFCKRESPYYGLCLELLSWPYGCPHCKASFSTELVSLKRFFKPRISSEKLKSVWQPLDDWIQAVSVLKLDMVSLRNWIIDHTGIKAPKRRIDAMHILGALVPLPRGRFVWRNPGIRRKAIYFAESAHFPRKASFSGNYIHEAYFETRSYLERRLTDERVTRIIEICRRDGWMALKALEGPEEIAYAMWRTRLENLSDPSLLFVHNAVGVYLSVDTVPLPYWSFDTGGWRVLFLAMYRSYLYEIGHALKSGANPTDVYRYAAMSQCCIFQSTDMHARGRGVVIYTMEGAT
jgi:hypothetical protein